MKYEKKFQKGIQNAELNYVYGDYNQSQLVTRRLLKKYAKKGLAETENYAILSLYNAKFLTGLGRYHVVQDSLENALFYFKSFVKPDSNKYGFALLLLSDLYESYGNYVKAYEYLQKAEKYAKNNGGMAALQPKDQYASLRKKKDKPAYLDPIFDTAAVQQFNYDLEKLKIMIDRGFYKESEGEFDKLIAYQSKMAQREFPLADTTGKKKTAKIKKKEFKKRNVDLAKLYVAKADFLRLRGNYSKAASMYQENDRILEQLKVSQKSYPGIRNDLGRAIMAENDNRLEKPYKVYQDLRKRVDRSAQVSNYHKIYNEIVEHEIYAFIDAEKGKKAKDLFLKYKLDNMNKYGKNSIYFLHALMLENEYTNRKKRYKKAVKYENRLKEGIDEALPTFHIDHMAFNDHFYEFYKRNNKVEEARIERETNEEIARINYGDDSPVYSMAKLDLANFNIDMQDQFANSKLDYEKHFDQVVERQLHDHHPDYSVYLKYYSKLKAYTDDYEKAYDLSSQVLKISDERFGNTSEEYGMAMIDCASLNIDRGQFDDAEKQLAKATDIIKDESGKKSLNYYLALMELAELYQISGKYKEADETMQKAYKYAKKSKEGVELSTKSSDELASLYITQGRYKAAEEIIVKSIELNEKKYDIDHYRLVQPLSLYAQLYLVTGEYINAEKKVQRALEISEKTLGDTSVAYMDNLILQAEIYVSMGNYKDAERIYGDAQKLIRSKFGENNFREADILQKLADVEYKSDEASLEEINKKLEQAKEIVTLNFSSSHPQYADLLEYQGRVFLAYKEYEKAESNVLDARKIWYDQFGKKHIKSARNEKLMGDVDYEEGKYKEAYENYKQSSETFKDVQHDNHPEYIEARSKMGKSLFAKGDLTGAMKIYDETTEKYLEYIQKYFPALSEKEKSSYWNSIKGDFETYNSLALSFSDKKGKLRKTTGNIYNFKLSTKAILLSSSAKLKNRIVNSGDGELIYRFGLYNEYRESLTKGLSMDEAERAEAGIDMEDLEKQINALEKELSEESEDFAQAFDSEQFTWKDVKKSLKPNEYAIEITRFRHFDKQFSDSIIYAAMIVHRKSKAPEIVILENGNKLDTKFFKYYTNTIKYKIKDKKSYSQFWQEIDERIPDSATIFISADGVYNQMNIETLTDNNKTYIIDKNDIYYVSNTKDIVLKARQEYEETFANTAFLIGNPEFAGEGEKIDTKNKVSSIEPLPGAEKEIKDVTKLLAKQNWKHKTYLGAEATETVIKEMQSPRVFHVATHGFFMSESKNTEEKERRGDIHDNPLLRSGLLFKDAGELLAKNNVYDFNKKDGILTAYEAMNLNLDNTELVVLSACETGRGEIKSGEGVYGLQRSFIVAGADNVIMTLFKVNDEVTQELMNDFYKSWLSGTGKRQAFQDAKKRIKEKYDKPIFWGSFMLIGLD